MAVIIDFTLMEPIKQKKKEFRREREEYLE